MTVATQSCDLVLMPVGRIRTSYQSLEECPRAGRLNGSPCTIVLEERFTEALMDIEAASHLHIMYWLDRARRDAVTAKTFRDGVVRGVFANRAPMRPNPIGLSVVRLLERKGAELTVSGLDCLDGTPVLDIKPYIPGNDNVSDATLNWKDG
jgi:tRNA-Thr(GGU) m(6)t(6)A37 methyltransferase TsaA